MADNTSQPNLDLEQILQTLASFQQPPDRQEQHGGQPELLYDPTRASRGLNFDQPGTVHSTQPVDPRPADRPAPQHQAPQRQQERSSTPAIDPSTITEWKHGLRCVSKVGAQDPNFAPAIRKLIKDQERNIRDWETGRSRLIEDQNLKRENEATHRAALLLPGLLDGTAPLHTPESEEAELLQYDEKVYRASKSMVESQCTQLKKLGVPFFGVKLHLITAAEATPSSPGAEDQTDEAEDGKITKTQLLELQRKMLNHLMELYGD